MSTYVIIVVLITGCSNSSSSEKKKEKSNSNNTSEKEEVTNVLIGEWLSEKCRDCTDTTMIYNSDLSGEMRQGSTTTKYTYEFIKTKLTIAYEGLSKSEYTYKVNGNTLSLTNAYGESINYIKQ